MRPAGRRWAAALLAPALLVAACSGDDDDGTAATTAPPGDGTGTDETTTTAEPAEPMLDEVELGVEQIADLHDPVAFAARPSTDDLYIAEKGGTVRIVKVTPATSTREKQYQLQDTPVLDLSDEVIDRGEQGLLGIAFSSDGRRLYVDLTAEPDGRTLVLEYELGDRTTVDLESRRELLEVEQPYPNHNGGHVVVGRDGYLYIGLGDGGDRGDPHGHAQDTETLLGSILRIDPLGGDDDGDDDADPYTVPVGNPFASGDEGAPEIWLYGVRNPWRFSFDRATGDLWVADVGQNSWEEITVLPATGGFDAGRGANLGWDRLEGTHEFEGDNPPNGVLPIYEYSHDDGCSITGGFVYRGDEIETLRGAYLFADYCEPGLRAIQVDGPNVVDERTWDDLGIEGVQSFGEDQDGEIFVLMAGGPVLRLIAPETDDDE